MHVLSAALRVASSPHLKLKVLLENPITTSPLPPPSTTHSHPWSLWEITPFPAGLCAGGAQLPVGIQDSPVGTIIFKIGKKAFGD